MDNKTPFAESVSVPWRSKSPDRSRFTFTSSWFEDVRPFWEELTASFREKKLQILEIGSFEGASTTWILDNLMNHPESRMTAIDTFQGSMEHRSQDLASLEDRFRSNVSKCENADKLRVMKAGSDQALQALRQESAKFDLIYIDASHVAADVLHDAVICWRMLNLHGKVVFDDFTWRLYNEDCYNPRIAIMSFIQCAPQEMETTDTGSQMWVTKVPNHIPATLNPNPGLVYRETTFRFNAGLE